MWKPLGFLLLFSSGICFSSGADSQTSCQANPCELNEFFKSFASFSFKVLLELIDYKKDPYVVFSPIPPLYTIAALSRFSCGETRQQLLDVVSVDSINSIERIIATLNDRMAQITINENLQFNPNASTLLANSRYPLTRNFLNEMQRLGVESTNIDLSDPEDGEREANDFIRDNSVDEGKRYANIRSGQLSENDRFFTWEYLYFRSKLINGVGKSRRFTDNFYSSPNEPVQKATYVSKILYCKYGYNSEVNSKIVELPLQQDFNAIYVVPDAGEDLYYVLEKFTKYDILSVFKTLPYKWVNVTLLYADHLETEFNSVNVIRNVIGPVRIYDYRRSQVKGAVVGDPPMALTNGVQKLYWTIDYSGTQEYYSQEEPEETFTGNRPFAGCVIRNDLIYMCVAFLNASS